MCASNAFRKKMHHGYCTGYAVSCGVLDFNCGVLDVGLNLLPVSVWCFLGRRKFELAMRVCWIIELNHVNLLWSCWETSY